MPRIHADAEAGAEVGGGIDLTVAKLQRLLHQTLTLAAGCIANHFK